MNNNIPDPLDSWTRQTIKKVALEKPSADFNQKVMSKVLNLSTKSNKPLISNTLWLILSATLAIIIYLGTLLKTTDLFFGSHFTNKHISRWVLQLFNDWNLSSTLTSIVVSSGIILIVQIIYLKQWHTKKWNTLT
ncbi:MAG: hypothetical protein IPG55_01885 [Saprospiraceae bacterium]|mgnify:FL=1|jgi:hypothetical protein|nr:hypothetical protein [Candidatus Defluviibacterium haderslevense]MCC7028255.1 hypothetical protein [Saprospiraceae bacterium]MCI1267185.1 hypothetical protein [Saprospiraceae bacterium]